MVGFFDICGTHIPISTIKDFRVIQVEFIYRPVYQEIDQSLHKSTGNKFERLFTATFRDSKQTRDAVQEKKFEFVAMQPYAAIIGQQGHKSALGEYKAKDFKEAVVKDISGAVIYTIADKLKLKAFKQQKYQCLNLAGRAFTTFLDDVPVMLTWNDGRVAEVHKEDPLYVSLGENTTPGIQYVSALIIKGNETFCFYGNGIQLEDATFEYERLKYEMDGYFLEQKKPKRVASKEKITLPQIPKFQISAKSAAAKESDIIECIPEDQE